MKTIFSLVVAIVLAAGASRAATLEELRVQAKLALDQDTATTATQNYPNPMIDRFVNEGLFVVSVGAGCVEKDTTVLVLVDKTEYAMPHDYVRAIGAILSMTGELVYQPRGLKLVHEFELGSSAGGRLLGPQQAVDKGRRIRKLILYPAPLIDVDTMRVNYLARARRLDNDTALTDVPDEYLGAVTLYAAWRAYGTKKTGSNPYREDMVTIMNVLGVAFERPKNEVPETEVVNRP